MTLLLLALLAGVARAIATAEEKAASWAATGRNSC